MPIGDCMTPPPNFSSDQLQSADRLVEVGIPRDIADRVTKLSKELFDKTVDPLKVMFDAEGPEEAGIGFPEMLATSIAIIALADAFGQMFTWAQFSGSLIMNVLKEEAKPQHGI